MSHARSFPILTAGLCSALTVSFGQSSDPELDSSAGTSTVMDWVDLTIPVLEPEPAEGYTVAPPAHTLDRLRPRDNAQTPPEVSQRAGSLSIRETIKEALVDVRTDGEIWVRTKDFRSSFTKDGFTVYPIFGARSSQEWPVQFQLRSARRGSTDYDVTNGGVPTRSGKTITQPHADVQEVFHLNVDSIEQTFVFDALPGAGDLLLKLAVDTELAHESDGESLRFTHPEFGGVTYGNAIVLDAAGRRLPIPRTYEDGAVHFTVPSSFLAEATLPVTIDPVLSTFTNGFGNTSDDGYPDICYAGVPGRYFMCWQELTSTANADVYCTSFAADGTQGASWGVEMTNALWKTPRIGHVPAFGALLIVASRTDAGMGAIMGRRASAIASDNQGAEFFISTSGSSKLEPCIGGTSRSSVSNNHYFVAWSRRNTTAVQTLEYRIIDWSGSPVTAVTVLDSAPGIRSRQPAVSKSYGDSSLFADIWAVVWIRDSENDQRGQVWARGVSWNGTLQGASNFVVEDATSCVSPTVSAPLDETIPGTGERPYVAAWSRRIGMIGGTRDNIHARVIRTGGRYPLCDISGELEDFDRLLDKFSPSIGSDGRAFVLTYSEESFENPGGVDYDTYLVSGNLAGSATSPRLALMERHQLISNGLLFDSGPRVAMRRDGDPFTVSDEGMCALTLKTGPTVDYGRTFLARVEAATNANSTGRAVGVQYCNSVLNSVGNATDLRTGSWLHIEGTQSVNQLHTLRCIDMPANQFGLLIAATATGNSLNPGGSAGRLCLGGLFGRYNNQVSSSGPAGVFLASIDPGAIEQPNGTVAAAPGQTWYFQVWHRDLDTMGVPTSNFSNACSLTFQP